MKIIKTRNAISSEPRREGCPRRQSAVWAVEEAGRVLAVIMNMDDAQCPCWRVLTPVTLRPVINRSFPTRAAAINAIRCAITEGRVR